MIFVMIVVVKQTIGVTISTSGGYENIVIKLSQDLEQELKLKDEALPKRRLKVPGNDLIQQV